jgi:CubicO group peptidase (beta-lactamase class C family)
MPLTAESVARIEAALDAVTDPTAPGLAAVVLLDGEEVHRSCRGLANLEYDVPITPTTTFHIASMSKQFAGFALAMVADRGLLDLDGDVREHLPHVPDLGVRITPRQLAHHTSGLRDQWGALVLSGWRMDDVITTADVLSLIGRMESLNFAPGTGFSYSNAGYTLMAELIRVVDGRTLREFCAQELFEPLGMADTHFHDRHDELVPGRSYSYVPSADGGWRQAHLGYAVVGATSLHTTVEDLARWDRNLSDRTVGSDAVHALMDEIGVLADGSPTGYAFGLMHDTHRGLHRVHHAGGDAGFRTQGERFPDVGLSVYVLCNSPATNPVAIARSISDVVLDQLGVAPAETTGGPVTDAARLAGRFLHPATGWTLDLDVQDDQLIAGGQPLTQLEPGRLAMATAATLRFAEDGDSFDLAMTAMQAKQLVRYEPVTTTDVSSLVGTYWSDELQTGYAVEEADGALVLLQREHGRMPLVPTVEDCFTATVTGLIPMGIAVAFDRDGDGSVTGFRLSMPRIDNIKVKRV